MKIVYEDDTLEQLALYKWFTNGYDRTIVRAYRMRIQLIRAAKDERDFYALKSLHFEKLKGNREGQYSMRLNKQWRLILRFARTRLQEKVVVVTSITDYH